jgi:hypothetical protein
MASRASRGDFSEVSAVAVGLGVEVAVAVWLAAALGLGLGLALDVAAGGVLCSCARLLKAKSARLSMMTGALAQDDNLYRRINFSIQMSDRMRAAIYGHGTNFNNTQSV